jgi:hypothetical protein
MGAWSAGVPVLFIVLGIGAAIRHLWIPAAIALVLAAFGLWLIALYNR